MKRALLAAAMLALGGCVDHIRTLREAEQTFSRAAEQENLGRFDRQGNGPLPGNVTDTTGYRIAAEMTAKLIKEKRADLEQDKLLCTAYVIRAFSLWRLGEFAQATEVSRQPCGDDKATPRDRVLLRVVPALVGIDESNARAHNGKPDKGEQKDTAEQIEAAVKTLKAADEGLPRNHPLRAYLFSARLAALRVAHVSPNREGLTGTDESDVSDKAMADADATILDYRKYLHCQLGLTKDPEHPSVSYWQSLFGISTDPSKTIDCKKDE